MPGGKKSAGRRPRKKQRPEGEKKHFKKRPGPQAQREQRPEGEEKHFKKWPGPQAQKKHSQLATNNPPNGQKEIPLKGAKHLSDSTAIF